MARYLRQEHGVPGEADDPAALLDELGHSSPRPVGNPVRNGRLGRATGAEILLTFISTQGVDDVQDDRRNRERPVVDRTLARDLRPLGQRRPGSRNPGPGVDGTGGRYPRDAARRCSGYHWCVHDAIPAFGRGIGFVLVAVDAGQWV